MPRQLLKKNQQNRIKDFNRPWGGFWQYTHDEISTVKILQLDPGKRLSYQFHQQRSEIWIALDAGLYAIINNKKIPLAVGQLMEIPVKTKHRMGNDARKPARWLEITLGKFDEDDIVRLKDDFGRV